MPAKPPASRSPKRLRKAKAQPRPSKEAEREARKLSLFVRQVREFRLALALYNEPLVRERLIRELGEELKPLGIRMLTLDLREPSPERTLLARVEALVKSAPGERVAVMVVNLEGCIDYTPELSQPGGPGTAFVETANFHRELFPKVCPGPLVFWMTELLERAFVRHAPDLWHWRSHVFDFRTRQAPREEDQEGEKQPIRGDDFRLHPEVRLQKLEEELAAYRKAGSRFDEMRVLNAIGLARVDGGDARLAQQDFEAVLFLARELGERSWEGAALGNLGNTHSNLGNLREAIVFYENARTLDSEIGNRRGEGKAFGNLGIVYKHLGELQKAIDFQGQHLAIAREVGERGEEGMALNNLGVSFAASGDARKAVECYQQALVIAREIGNRRGEGKALGNLANAYADSGDTHKAVELYEQALVIAREIGDRRGEGNNLWNSASKFAALGNPAEAIARAEAALLIREATNDPNTAQLHAALRHWRTDANPVNIALRSHQEGSHLR